jgi:fibronectin-binding autotransporter adhesin
MRPLGSFAHGRPAIANLEVRKPGAARRGLLGVLLAAAVFGGPWGGASWIAHAATLDLNGLVVTLPAAPFFITPYLTGSNGVTNTSLSSATLIEGGGPVGTTYSGVISNGASATSWIHTGGDVIITGANTLTGGTEIEAGNVTISGAGTLGGNGNLLTVAGGVLDLGGTTQTQNGGLTLSGGALQDGTLSSTGTFGLQSGAVSAALAGTGAGSKMTAGTVTLSGANTYSGGTTISAGTLQIGNGGTTGSIVGGVADNGTLAFDRSDNVNFGGVISGTGSLTQLGAGTLTLTGANTYSGPTTVEAGTLQAGAANAFSAASAMIVPQGGTLDLGGYNQAVSSLSDGGGIGGTVTNNGSNPATLTIQGGGSTSYLYSGVIQDGASKTGLAVTSGSRLYLEGANTYTGGTFVDSGGYLVVDVSASITGPVTVTNTGSLFFYVYGATKTFDGALSGNGTVAVQGNGTLILAGVNTNSQTNVDTNATLQIGNGGTTGSFTGNVENGGALVFNRSDNYAYGGVVSGDGSLTQAGLGVLTLDGANIYTGATTVQSGTLRAGAPSAFSALSATTVNSGATLDLAGFNQTVSSLTGSGTVTNSGGTLATLTNQRASSTFSGGINDGAGVVALTESSPGATLTLSGTNTYSGVTTVAAGTLMGGATNAFSAVSATTVNAGGTLDLGGLGQTINTVNLAGGVIQNGVLTSANGITSIGGTLNQMTVSTSGTDGHALHVAGAGAQLNLIGTNTFTTQGAGAIGLYASLGGFMTATGATNITTSGGGAYGVNADSAGGQIKLTSANVATAGAGAFGLYASDAAASGGAGSISTTGTLNVTTTNPAAAAIGLQGNGASVLATGGGKITSAGDAIEFLGGTDQTATFDGFDISTQSGDIVFADPSMATITFNNSTVDAATGYLLDATGGSVITFNASASTLTGAMATDAVSTSNVNLTNGTVWNLTGPSNVTSLAVTNSAIVFAPPGTGGGFKTLTVNNYVGSGADIILNTALGGSSSPTDRIVVSGGSATGQTVLTIRNAGGVGGLTTGAGIPIVITTNGGTTASDAFALSSTPVLNGFRYTLVDPGGDWYLVSSPTTTQAQVQNSINAVAKAQQNQMVTNRVLGSILLGATEQISCSNCGSGFGSIGSLGLGAHGRCGLSDQLTAMGGFSYNQWSSNGISVYDAPIFAGSLVYDFSNLGDSRPFIEAGGELTPYELDKYSRNYPNGYGTVLGTATAVNRALSLFARLGWLARLSSTDEAAVYGDLGRSWMQTGGYSEATTAINPYPATVASGLDTLNVARIGGQCTHLFDGGIEANVSAGIAYGFGAGSGSVVNVYDFGPIAPNALPSKTWFEYGARIGYRASDSLVVDAFVVGTAGGAVGATAHGGTALRVAF